MSRAIAVLFILWGGTVAYTAGRAIVERIEYDECVTTCLADDEDLPAMTQHECEQIICKER